MTTLVPDPLERPLLTAEEVAPILDCGTSAVHEAIRRGEVPHIRLGRRILVPTASLRREVLGIDPPGPTADVVLAVLRDLLATEEATSPTTERPAPAAAA